MNDQARRSAEYLQRMAATLAAIDPTSLAALTGELWQAWNRDSTVFVAGNGGSASTASHLACDLSKQTLVAGRRPMRVLALTDNVAVITAWSNDAGASRVFAEQLNVHARPGDVLLCISASGNSANIVAAIEEARAQGLEVLALGGFDGGRMQAMADVYVHVPSHDYGVVESAHVAVEHCVTALIEHLAQSATVSDRIVDSSKPVLILDRDGVINRNIPDGVRSWEEFTFLPGALEALARATRAGHRVVVVTNQANLRRGLLTPAMLSDIHRRMLAAVIDAGGEVEQVYVCGHGGEDGCDCRKPASGLLLRAATELGFALDTAYMIGDHASDMAAANAVGATSILVRSGRGSVAECSNGSTPAFVVEDLPAAIDLVLRSEVRLDGARAATSVEATA